MFRGFRAAPGPRGRLDYDFVWLMGRPMRARFDAARRQITLPALFPGVGARSGLASALDEVVRSRTARDRPAHKRIDGRRASASSAVRGGDWSLGITIRGGNHAYAVRAALNLVNDLFLTLRERYPEYLIERFGLSAE